MTWISVKSVGSFTFFQPIADKSSIMDMAVTQNENEKLLETRDKSRESIFLGAVISLGNQRKSLNVRVRNISSGGMMIDLAGPQPKGLAVTAEMKGIGEVRGRIAWSTENRAGIVFDRTVDAKLARHIVAAAPPAPIYARPISDPARRPGLAIR
jgi:PilZ domain